MKEKQKNRQGAKKANAKKKIKKNNNYRGQQLDNEEIEDVMGWGKSKNNYYQNQEEQSSQLSEQYQQAQEIYQKQQDALDQAEFYNLPGSDQQSISRDNQIQLQEQEINEEYLKEQILWCVELIKLFEGINDDKSKFRGQLCHAYLMVVMCLKQFKNIPYIQEHPMFQNMHTLKKGIQKLQRQFQNMMEHESIGEQQVDGDEQIDNEEQEVELDEKYSGDYDQEDQEELQRQMISDNQQQSSDKLQKVQPKQKNKKSNGLELYEKIKADKQSQKKLKKLENKNKRIQNLPTAAFKTIKDSEGRLASEKIVKNKGLIKRRKKIDGNSRVKLREKYRKAQIKRRTKGFIGVRQDPGRFYEGENKVLMGKIASTKL